MSTNTLNTACRLPLRQPPYPSEVIQAISNPAFGKLSPINLRLALAHHPKLAATFQAMAHTVLFGGDVSEAEREVAIIRTGALTQSEYEWGMHVSIYAHRCGLTEEHVAELTYMPDWQRMSARLWAPNQLLIIRMVDELHRHSTVSDETWQRLAETWPREQVIELIFACSFYHMAAFFLNSAAVPLEDGARRFPAGVAQASVPSLAPS